MTESADYLVVERSIKAAPATVFSFFSSAERWTLWQGTSATIEARPGGMFRMIMPDGQTASGQFLEVVPNQRLVFTWGWEGLDHPVPPGSSTVEIDLLPEAEGTRLRLTHRGLAQPFIDPHRQGWLGYLARLAAVAQGGTPEPDPGMDS
jgi:uncharacterized protein YndB with AHSA1/START domain